MLNTLVFYYLKKNQLIKASLCVLVPSTIDLVFLIYIVGGINAPGVFWLSILPLFYGTFFDKKGAIIGAVITLTTYIIFIVLDHYQLTPQTPFTPSEFKTEKIINLFNYSLVAALYYISYTSVYERTNHKISNQRDTINNLYRVVLHDITNPISSIKLQIKRMHKKNSYEKENILAVESSVNGAISIIENLRSFKVIEDGILEIPLRPEKIKDIMSSFLETSKLKLKQKSIELNIEYNQNENTNVLCHKESLVDQVLTNILTNAIKFSEDYSKINISLSTDKDYAYITTTDYGIGIPDDILKNIFQFDKATTRLGINGEKGTGYGMPIVKYFMHLMNGDIEIQTKEKDQNSKKSGTTIIIKLQKTLS